MNKIQAAAMVCLLTFAGNVAGQTFTLPPVTDNCSDEAADAFNRGFAHGQAQACDSAFQDGYAQGTAQGIETCQADPLSCNITLGSVLNEGGYGETEPNDNMVAADALLGGAKFLGQSYGPQDQDWYYLVTSNPNQILTVHFSVPLRDPETTSVSDWIVEVRDAAGNLYATFATSFISDNTMANDEIAYPVALGLVGTYYVVVKPSRETLSGYPYALAVVLQDSDLEGAPLVVKNFDSEVEPNNFYSQANPLATGVTMYGLINLRFDSVIEGEDGASYGQGEPDWFVYETAGNEIATLSFCDKEVCEQGDWEVRVYDAQGAALADAGADAAPLVAFNTASGLGWPDSVHFGLIDPGSYYILVNHKRKFDAPCRESRLAQECLNPGGLCVESVCSRTCRITASDNAGNLGAACSCPEGSESCNVFVADDVSLSTCSCGAEQCGDVSVPNCGFDDLTLQDVCWERSEECLVYGGVVEVPEDETTSQYNFTLFGTKLDPFTVNTPAYDQFEQRPSWFNSP